jgi:hypothetical protein
VGVRRGREQHLVLWRTARQQRPHQPALSQSVRQLSFADGWSVGSSPEITANWIASSGKWTVPVGGGFGKAFHLAGQAMKLDFNAFYNAIRPKAVNDTWLLQVKLTFQFPD